MYTEPVKITKKKKIELIVLIVVALWFVLFAINYVRYSQGKSLIFSIKIVSDYEDGSVKEYYSLGYVYRIYNRDAISREEFVPFFVLRENPLSDDGIPDTYKDYTVPDNKSKLEKYKGLLYFYDKRNKFIGTYKCINTTTRCEYAVSGHDNYDLINKDPLTRKKQNYKFSVLYEKYAFIDDSKTQDYEYGHTKYERIIYFFDIENNEILAKFDDIKDSYFDEDAELSYSDDYNFIVKSTDTNKWGLVKIKEDGSIEQVLDYVYDSISYDQDTKYYILSKENKWFVYDLRVDKYLVSDVTNPIYDVWVNSNKSYFYKTGVDVIKDGFNYINYSIYRFEGNALLSGDYILEVVARENCYIYMDKNTRSLRFMDYTNRLLYEIPLSFIEMEYDDFTHPAFEIYKDYKGNMYFKIYKGRELHFDYDDYIVDYESLTK